jgi:autotransporter-associated beta strand protein
MLILSGTNSYDGYTTVEGGTLLVTGTHVCTNAQYYDIKSGGTLGGTGSIDIDDSRYARFYDGSTLAGGDANGYGTLTLSESLILALGVTNRVVVGDAAIGQHSAVAVTGGSIDLNGATLVVDDTAFVGASDTITIIDNGTGAGISDTFAGLADGAIVTGARGRWIIHYNGGDGDDVTLTHLPSGMVFSIR